MRTTIYTLIIIFMIHFNSFSQNTSLGDTLQAFNAGILTPTPDRGLAGVEFAEGHFWVTGFDPDDTYQHKLYKISADGQTLVNYWDYGLEFAGWKDLAYDGQYLYVADIDTIRQIDMTTGQKTGVKIPGPEYYLSGLAYDPYKDRFWVSGDGNLLYEIDRQGNIIRSLEFLLDYPATGLAWDTWTFGGPYLWIWSMKYTPSDVRPKAYQMSPQSGMLTGLTLEGVIMEPSGVGADYSLGACITDELIPGKVSFVGLHGSSYQVNNDQLDWVVSYDLDPQGVGRPGPEITVDPGYLINDLEMGDSTDVAIDITNIDNEYPLNWYATLEYPGLTDTTAILGDTLQVGDITAITPDSNTRLNSIAYIGEFAYISTGLDFNDQFKIYKVNKNGTQVIQTYTLYSAFSGWSAMTSDDQYLYGTETYTITKFDPATGSIVENYLKPGFSPSSLAYDPQMEHFYLGNGNGAIMKINKDGDELNFYVIDYDIEGMAWDDSSPGGPYLWVFYLSASGNSMHAARLEPESGSSTGVEFMAQNLSGDPSESDLPLDIAITSDWAENKLVMLALQESNTLPGDGHDKMVVYDLATTPPPGWIDLLPGSFGTTNALMSDTLNVRLRAIMEDTLVVATIVINSNDVINYRLEIPVNFTMLPQTITFMEDILDEPQIVSNIYPNPANEQFTVSSNVPMKSIRILGLNGKLVRSIDNPGRKITLNTTSIQRGVYFIQLITKDHIEIKKLIIN